MFLLKNLYRATSFFFLLIEIIAKLRDSSDSFEPRALKRLLICFSSKCAQLMSKTLSVDSFLLIKEHKILKPYMPRFNFGRIKLYTGVKVLCMIYIRGWMLDMRFWRFTKAIWVIGVPLYLSFISLTSASIDLLPSSLLLAYVNLCRLKYYYSFIISNSRNSPNWSSLIQLLEKHTSSIVLLMLLNEDANDQDYSSFIKVFVSA